jgi:hypothetical protein
LCRDEYNKVSGLDNAKQIWDTLKISHEGNDATMITKVELVESELDRFAVIRGEEPMQTYNRLKTLVNKIRSYGSTRWTDHDVVRLMLRLFIVIDPHLVNLIRENPRYTKMTSEEILGKFVSGRMMVKEARYVDDALNGPLPIYEPQLVALKATSSKETLPSKVAQVEATGLNKDEMALIIKRFKTALKGRKEYPNKNKTRGKRSCFKCGKTGHFIANYTDNGSDQGQEKSGKKEKKKSYRKAKGEAHLEKEWDSDCSSFDCWGEGEDATLRSRPSSTRYTNGGKLTGVAHPSSSSLQDEGLRRSLSIPRPHPAWRPTWDSAHCNRPRTEKRVTGLICNSFSVMTVCNPLVWEYSGDCPGARGHKRPYIGTLDTRAPINTPVQYP